LTGFWPLLFKLGRLSNTTGCATTAATLWARFYGGIDMGANLIKTAVATELYKQ